MDQAAQVASNLNFGILKEPRGFIKCIQLIIAIFAFATTTSPTPRSEFSISCSDGTMVDLQVKSSYPYVLSSQNTYMLPACNSSQTEEVHPYGNFRSSAEFYVFVGVMAFLYTIGALVIYIMFDDKYRQNDNIPTADFVISAVFAVLWLISSSAWAQGVSDLKYYGSPDFVMEYHIPECKDNIGEGKTCQETAAANYASLNVSIIFGFLNMIVWGGNLWFLFKETKWFKANQAPAQTYPPPTEPPQMVPPQRV